MPVSKLPHAFSSSMRHNALALYSFAVLICAACILLGGAAQAVAAQESSANSVHVESLASMGGSAAAYAAEGDYLFVGQGAGIAVFDVSVPNNPVEIAHYGPLDGAVQHIAVQDHILYAALGESGLAIIDAATPTAMKTLARYPAHRATYVAVDGKRVYLADNEDRLLRLVDVRKPAAPTLLGTFAPNASVRAMSVAGNRVFLSLSTYGLQIVDVTDPASPKSVAHHTSLMTSQAVEFVGGYAIVIEWDSDARIYDFSNPAVLKKLAVLDRVNALDVRASYAYALGWDGLTVWDLSDPANPVQLLVRQGSVADGERIFVTKNRAFIIDSSDDIVVFDLSQPTVPLEVGSLSMAASEARLASMDGSRLVAASGSKLTAYDLAELGNTVQDAPYSLSGQAMALTVCGQWAFVAVDGGKLGLEIVHIEAAGELKRIGFLATDAAIRKLFCSGAYVYAQQSDRFLVIDVSNPAKPRQVGSYAVPAGVRAMALDPPRAYVADEADALHIVDISGSPPGAAQPRLLGTYSDPQSYVRIHTLAAGDGHVYLGRGDQIDVVDVSDAAHPRKLGSLTPHPSAMSALFYQASHLLAYYEGSYYSGAALHFVNVTDPAHPVETAVFEPTFYGADLAASNGYIAFADDENGLAVYWWSPAVTASFAATGPVDFSPTASVTYRVDAAGLLPAGSTAAARTVNLEHFRPYLPQRGQAGPLDEVVAPFTLQATDAASGKALVPSTSLKITVRLSADQLEAIDPQSIALYAWTGTAWAQLPSSRFDPTSGVLTASAPQFAPWGVRAASRTPGTAVFLPYVAQPGPDVALNAFEVTQSTQSLSNSVP
ncbi:MAG: hypothetical protein QM346_09555, partial [Chloroflexota bacterium]|nr:hypothetical protein [Chloroflexota bacterium]